MCVHVNKTKMGRDYIADFFTQTANLHLMTSLGRYVLGFRKISDHDFDKRARFHLKSRSYVLML